MSVADLKLIHRIDKLHMEFPFAGSRTPQGLLVQEGFTRRVLAWRASITLETDFCIEAVEEVLAKYGTPERSRSA